MAIKEYFKSQPNGKKIRLYTVTAESINKYTGKRCSKKKRGISSKTKAQKIYKELWNQCRNEKPAEFRVETLGQLIEAYLTEFENQIRKVENTEGWSLRTFHKKRALLSHLSSWHSFHLDLITPRFINRELDKLEGLNLASRSLTQHILKEVKCSFTFAMESGVIKYNPFGKSKNRKLPKKRRQALNHSEANYFLQEAFRRKHPYYFVWLLALTLGLRRSELAGLMWTDIDFGLRLLYVQRQLLPKRNSSKKPKAPRAG